MQATPNATLIAKIAEDTIIFSFSKSKSLKKGVILLIYSLKKPDLQRVWYLHLSWV